MSREAQVFLTLNGTEFRRALGQCKRDMNEFRTGVNEDLKMVAIALLQPQSSV